MAEEIKRIEVPIVQILGLNAISLLVKVRIDRDLCRIEYESFEVLGSDDIELDAFDISFGLNYDFEVNQFDVVTETDPENPGRCRKVLRLEFDVFRTISLFFRRRDLAFTKKVELNTSFLEQCCMEPVVQADPNADDRYDLPPEHCEPIPEHGTPGPDHKKPNQDAHKPAPKHKQKPAKPDEVLK